VLRTSAYTVACKYTLWFTILSSSSSSSSPSSSPLARQLHCAITWCYRKQRHYGQCLQCKSGAHELCGLRVRPLMFHRGPLAVHHVPTTTWLLQLCNAYDTMRMKTLSWLRLPVRRHNRLQNGVASSSNTGSPPTVSGNFTGPRNCNCNWSTCIAPSPSTRRPRLHHRVNPYPIRNHLLWHVKAYYTVQFAAVVRYWNIDIIIGLFVTTTAHRQTDRQRDRERETERESEVLLRWVKVVDHQRGRVRSRVDRRTTEHYHHCNTPATHQLTQNAYKTHPRPSTRECVCLVTRGHCWSRDKAGAHTTGSIIAKPHAAHKLHGCMFYRTGVTADQSFTLQHCGFSPVTLPHCTEAWSVISDKEYYWYYWLLNK